MNALAEAHLADLPSASSGAGWRAELRLAYQRRGARTVLVERAHRGPLVVQRPLYPEGETVCHTILVHPPAGIAGGDRLRLTLELGASAHVLLTTPGAGKWYRSAGARGELVQRIRVAEGGAWRECLNSDSSHYGGTNAGNQGRVLAEPVPMHGHPWSLSLHLPPLAVIWLEREPEA